MWGLGCRSGKALRFYSDGPGIDSRWCQYILSDIFSSDLTMALGSTQPLVKMSTRNIPGGKGGRCMRLPTSPPSCAECHEIWEPKPPGTVWDTLGLLRTPLPFITNCVCALHAYAMCMHHIVFCGLARFIFFHIIS